MKNIKLIGLITTFTVATTSLIGCIETTSTQESSSTQTGQEFPTAPPIVIVPEVQTPSGPGDTPPPTPPTPPTPPRQSENGSLVINNGAARTKADHLDLSIYFINENVMKISLNDTCTGGTWETYSSTKVLTTFNKNQLSKVSVQFKDYDDFTSPCYKDDILHDDMAPQILFAQSPAASLEEGSQADIIYDVQDSGVGVKTVVCKFNDLVQACNSGRNTVQIPSMLVGQYIFTVTATDDLGNQSQQSTSWQVTSSYRHLTQNINVNDYRKVDVLFVIDNSGSMEFEQRSMAQRVRNFLSVIHGLDWQVAVTTTDPRVTFTSNNIKYTGDGDFIKISGTNDYILTSATPEDVAQTRLGLTLQRAETGSGTEQGILAAYRAIQRRSEAGNANHVNFFRDGAQLAVVLISDEDESANGVKNDPQNLVTLVNQAFAGQKRFSYHSIITVPDDTVCKSTNGATYGVRYKTMSNLTGGVIGSVCADDYAAQLESVAQGVRDLLKTLTLECTPQITGLLKIEVSKNGQPYAGAYTVEGVNLKFADVLEPADYSVKYSCLK